MCIQIERVHLVLKDIEAWSIEFNDKSHFIHTAHWLSP